MAHKDQLIENKTFGDKIRFLVSSKDSGGEKLSMEIACKPGAVGPPLHYHPVQSESFEVVSGELSVVCDDKKIVLKPGEKITVGPNSAHKWWNEGIEDLVMIVDLSPALKTEFFLETVYSLDVQNKTNKKTGLPGVLQFAAILNECYGELFVVGPPIIAQKFMAKVIGSFAKLIGYKGYVPFPRKGR